MYIYIYIYNYIYIYVCVCYINILYNCKLDGVIINGTPLRPEESWSLVSWEAASWYSSSWTVSWDVKRNQQYEIYQCHQRWQLNMEVKFHDLHQKNMVILFTATIFTWFSHAFPMVFPWFTWNMLKWMVFCWANIVPRKTSRVFAHDNRQLQGSGWWLTYPSEKWWSESQLGWWNSQLNGTMKFMFQTTNQICTLIR